MDNPFKQLQLFLRAPRVFLEIDLSETEIRIFKRGRTDEEFQLWRLYDCAVGAKGHETPVGVTVVRAKAREPTWTKPASDWVPKEDWGEVVAYDDPFNPIKGAWVGISQKRGVGIHGTADEPSIGTEASHGCLRVTAEGAIEIYEAVKVGTVVRVRS